MIIIQYQSMLYPKMYGQILCKPHTAKSTKQSLEDVWRQTDSSMKLTASFTIKLKKNALPKS